MDSPTSFDDDDELFFGSYPSALAPLELDEADAQPPSPEQLAHWARFRRPVAGVVASMALLSIVALGTLGAQQPGPRRELVAHYDSALPAPALAKTATVQHAGVVLDASSASVPEALSALFADALSALVPEAASAADAAAPALAVAETGPAPDTALTQIFIQADSNLDVAFSSPPPMCLLRAENDVTPARPSAAPKPSAKFKSVARVSDLRR